MISPLLATAFFTSTSNKIALIAGVASLLGIAVLSLLVFSQAREIRRLREWAGRAPERAADMEQKVSEAAAVRAQQPAQTVPAPQSPQAVQGVRPVPRAQPIHSRAAAATAAGVAATRVAGDAPPPAQPAAVPAGSQPVTATGAPAPPLPVPAGRSRTDRDAGDRCRGGRREHCCAGWRHAEPRHTEPRCACRRHAEPRCRGRAQADPLAEARGPFPVNPSDRRSRPPAGDPRGRFGVQRRCGCSPAAPAAQVTPETAASRQAPVPAAAAPRAPIPPAGSSPAGALRTPRGPSVLPCRRRRARPGVRRAAPMRAPHSPERRLRLQRADQRAAAAAMASSARKSAWPVVKSDLAGECC